MAAVASASALKMITIMMLVFPAWLCSRAVAQSEVTNFWAAFNNKFNSPNVYINGPGDYMQLKLCNPSGTRMVSYNQYLFGYFSVYMKLVPGDSAGTVTTFYVTSEGPFHDEIDLEFLGNATGQPYTLHTNVFSNGTGNREQQFRLWFDPTQAFHEYAIVWNPQHIVITVDGVPVREFRNLEYLGIPYPSKKPMNLIASIWNADSWATQGGRIKTDWSAAPFPVAYNGLNISGCVVGSSSSAGAGSSPPPCSSSKSNGAWWNTPWLSDAQLGQLQWARDTALIYDYCQDYSRFNNQLPPECYVH